MFFPLYSGVLSDTSVLKKIGKDIFIWPFNERNLKGSTYNLTASKIAYYKNEKGENISVIDPDGNIIIQASQTVLIQTEESIYIRKNYCGTYHTKVKVVSKGLSSISTTLDPCYFGTSLIALNNQTKLDVKIKAGETFCSLMLYKMKSASREKHDNLPFREDVASKEIKYFSFFEESESNSTSVSDQKKIAEIRKYYHDWYRESFRTNRQDLIDEVKKYKKTLFKKKRYLIRFAMALIGTSLGTAFVSWLLSNKIFADSTGIYFNFFDFSVSYDVLYGNILTPFAIMLFVAINEYLKD